MSKAVSLYLGDGIYATAGGHDILTLTTGHHDPDMADNTIVFGPEELASLFDFLNSVGIETTSK